MKTSRHNDANALIDILRKALEQLEAGYNPPFAMIIFPDADREDVHGIIGFDSGDIRIAKHFDDLIDNLQESYRDELLKRFVGFGKAELERAAEQYARDMKKASERALDGLIKDEPIKNMSDAKRLLAELMKRK